MRNLLDARARPATPEAGVLPNLGFGALISDPARFQKSCQAAGSETGAQEQRHVARVSRQIESKSTPQSRTWKLRPGGFNNPGLSATSGKTGGL